MNNKTLIIIIITVIALVGVGAIYNVIHSNDADIEYEYELFTYGYSYKDTSGTTHYASSEKVYVAAEIYEYNISDREVLGLPNCYSLVTPDKEYKWVTGTSDSEWIPVHGRAHIIVLFEVPKGEKDMQVVWNMETTRGRCIN